MLNPKIGTSRRTALRSLASASMLLPGMLHEMMASETAPGAAKNEDPLAPRAPMFQAKAKRVIFLYMSGGVSQVDTFDPKPKLTADHHKRYKKDFLHASLLLPDRNMPERPARMRDRVLVDERND